MITASLTRRRFLAATSAGFNGSILVECCKIGTIPRETMENARADRLFLEQVLASV